MTFLLRFTDAYDKHRFHYLCNLGDQWPRNPMLRMIERTSEDRTEARVFGSEEDARTCLKTCGAPKGWEILQA